MELMTVRYRNHEDSFFVDVFVISENDAWPGSQRVVRSLAFDLASRVLHDCDIGFVAAGRRLPYRFIARLSRKR